jgi:hypothetical protein
MCNIFCWVQKHWYPVVWILGRAFQICELEKGETKYANSLLPQFFFFPSIGCYSPRLLIVTMQVARKYANHSEGTLQPWILLDRVAFHRQMQSYYQDLSIPSACISNRCYLNVFSKPLTHTLQHGFTQRSTRAPCCFAA